MDVFDGIAIGKVSLKNRFARSATWEGMAASDGAVTPRLLEFTRPLAKGGLGLLISSLASVSKAGVGINGQLGAYDDALIPGLREMCDLVHSNGGVIFLQTAHAGARANPALTGVEPAGPSGFFDVSSGTKVREMTKEDIAALVDDFARASRRAVQAGFDGVQLHAAHGYALSQFLSPFYNKRTDGYGGSVEKRARILIDVYRAVRGEIGAGRPVTAKINSEDFLDGGLSKEMMAETALIMESEGLDAIELSGGGGPLAKYRSSRVFDPKTPAEEGYYLDAARMYKDRVKIPLMLVGGIRSLEASRRILSDGLADVISLSRPLIREPGLVKRWSSGDAERAKCVSCDGCRKTAASGEGLRCVLEG